MDIVYDTQFCDSAIKAWVRLFETRDALYRIIEADFGKVGITLAQAEVLAILKRSRVPLTPAEVSRYMFREAQTVSELLKRMEGQGYLKRVRDCEDERLVRIKTTKRGEEIAKQIEEVVSQFSILMSCFSEAELERFTGCLEILRNRALAHMGTELRESPTVSAIA